MEMAVANKTIKIESLPPSEGAARQHSYRVYQQVMDWKFLKEGHFEPADWGWNLQNGRYRPVFTDEPIAPDSLLKFIRCKCKLTAKQPCMTNCSCKKNGLHCVAACGNCRGDSCLNRAPISFENFEEEERNIFDILNDL